MGAGCEIDAVVTWVDGADESHAKAISEALHDKKNRSFTQLPSGRSNARYADNNEIEYCIRGIRRFMPWIRRIFLVTDNQVPSFLDSATQSDLGVFIVDHKVIFRGFEWALPTFNSISIGTVIHRIPGLAGRYIYFNDDVIPIRESRIDDFFSDGKVVLRGEWQASPNYGPWKTALVATVLKAFSVFSKKERSAHLLAQMRAAKMAGFSNCYFHSVHAPHPVVTETLLKFFSENKCSMANNIKYKFRSIEQFTAHPLAHHLEVARKNDIIIDGGDCVTLAFGKSDNLENKIIDMESGCIKFVCLQSLELAELEVKDRVIDFIEKVISAS